MPRMVYNTTLITNAVNTVFVETRLYISVEDRDLSLTQAQVKIGTQSGNKMHITKVSAGKIPIMYAFLKAKGLSFCSNGSTGAGVGGLIL